METPPVLPLLVRSEPSRKVAPGNTLCRLLPAIVTPFVVIVVVPLRTENQRLAPPLQVIPDAKVKLPKTLNLVESGLDQPNVGFPVAPVKSILRPALTISILTV